MSQKIAVIGGGAAGFFAAINIAERCPQYHVTIFEATNKVLSKVLISGGGRCNLTNFTLDPRELVNKYPRGNRELLGPFNQFSVNELMSWFTSRGVELKVEDDKRVFPITNNSGTIADCLTSAANTFGVKVRLAERVRDINIESSSGKYQLSLSKGAEVFDKVILTSGGSERSFELASALGHKIIPPVPSLFTFEIEDRLIEGLSGVSFTKVETSLKFGNKVFKNLGPLLITHWGLSGPAVIVLSSICARELHAVAYNAELRVNFLGEIKFEDAISELKKFREVNLKKKILNAKPFNLTNSFWERILNVLELDLGCTWQEISNRKSQEITQILSNYSFQITGKGKFKEEFVTAGGVSLKEVDFRTMESKVCEGLYFAGEVLNIDGVTGGFNFQSAWTTAWIASQSI